MNDVVDGFFPLPGSSPPHQSGAGGAGRSHEISHLISAPNSSTPTPALFKLRTERDLPSHLGQTSTRKKVEGDQIKLKMSVVEAGGTGLHNGITGKFNKFTVYTSQLGKELAKLPVTVAFDGPSEPDINLTSRDNNVEVSFKPYEPGTYTIHIKHDASRIRASPFTCKIVGERIKQPANK